MDDLLDKFSEGAGDAEKLRCTSAHCEAGGWLRKLAGALHRQCGAALRTFQTARLDFMQLRTWDIDLC